MALKINKPKPADKGKKAFDKEAGKDQTLAQAVGTTTIQHPDGSIENQQEVVAEKVQTEPLCTVSVNASRTFNLGDFNSLKVGVLLSVPAPANDIEDAFSFAKEWVDGKMNSMSEEVEAGLGGE